MALPDAYQALGRNLRGALLSAGVLAHPDAFEVDPVTGVEPSETSATISAVAGLIGLETVPDLRFLGSPRRYVVERQARLELAISGPTPEARAAVITRAVTSAATLPERDPTLGGLCERLEIQSLEDEDWPPNGQKILITFLLRVRSADALGMT